GEGQSHLAALVVATPCAVEQQVNEVQLGEEIARCLQAAAHEEQIRHFAVIDRPLSQEFGELTPKLSLCRETIARNFRETITQLYNKLSNCAVDSTAEALLFRR